MKRETSNNENRKEKGNKLKYKTTLIILALALVSVGVFATYAFFQTPVGEDQEEVETKKPVQESRKIVDVLLSKKNDASITDYNAGDKGEMFTFSHPEAEQTKGWSDEERTDYRYIGNTPNNYIQFNDETWRIIGVFTVEGENGKKEQRVKIIRDQLLGDFSWDMKADKTNSNEWPISSLATMLNEDYINKGGNFTYTWYDNRDNNGTANKSTVVGLNTTAKNQIGSAKWYLGGSHEVENLGASDYYKIERGTETCETIEECPEEMRSTSTIADVGLMYPSDYMYTYALGVDNICYTSGFNCGEGTPSAGWLFTSDYQWTIMPYTYDATEVFSLYDTGGVNGYYVVNSISGSRPVVYLLSDNVIIGGNGSIEHPYTLKN